TWPPQPQVDELQQMPQMQRTQAHSAAALPPLSPPSAATPAAASPASPSSSSSPRRAPRPCPLQPALTSGAGISTSELDSLRLDQHRSAQFAAFQKHFKALQFQMQVDAFKNPPSFVSVTQPSAIA